MIGKRAAYVGRTQSVVRMLVIMPVPMCVAVAKPQVEMGTRIMPLLLAAGQARMRMGDERQLPGEKSNQRQ